MPVMNFDLEDGLPPVSFTLKLQDAERFMAFMAECQQLRDAAPSQQVAPEGCKLARTYPTEKMVMQGRFAFCEIMGGVEPDLIDAIAASYRAMLAASPLPDTHNKEAEE